MPALWFLEGLFARPILGAAPGTLIVVLQLQPLVAKSANLVPAGVQGQR